MTTENNAQNLRDKTDSSLKDERLKTDEYIDEKNQQINTDIEETIRHDRQTADTRREVSRAEVDRKSDKSPTDSENVLAERARSDQAQTLERSKEDSVRKKERFQKRLIAEALLRTERQDTDTSLFYERNRIDVLSSEASVELNLEISSHDVTKTELLTRDQFLAIVSHDLRNPLSAITMSSELLREELSQNEKTNSESFKFLGIIERHTSLIDRLITDLLDVEKMSNKKLLLKTEKIRVSRLLQDCTDLFGSIAKAKSLSFSAHQEDSNLEVVLDYDRILQVLSNLIGNAIKFSPHGGLIKLMVTQNGSGTEFAVQDQGPGIPADKQGEIFERYSQLKSKNRTGLGLGLFISKWITQAHDGKIWVTSEAGQGSTFHFVIPAQ